jgi:hypothetical protein
MSKPGADPSSGISLGDALRRPKRHPACRRREAQSGSGTERENLAGDAKGKGASGSNREAEAASRLGEDLNAALRVASTHARWRDYCCLVSSVQDAILVADDAWR